MNDKKVFLRHTLATLSYRGGKVLREVPAEFAHFRPSAGTRTPLEILAHIGDLLEWASTMVLGQIAWPEHTPCTWEQEVERFFAELQRLDDHLAFDTSLKVDAEKIFQGPIADALTHVGQLGMLRRMAGEAVRGENYFVAEITAGRVGAEQAPPRREFD
jgi:hypothetical protein